MSDYYDEIRAFLKSKGHSWNEQLDEDGEILFLGDSKMVKDLEQFTGPGTTTVLEGTPQAKCSEPDEVGISEAERLKLQRLLYLASRPERIFLRDIAWELGELRVQVDVEYKKLKLARSLTDSHSNLSVQRDLKSNRSRFTRSDKRSRKTK